MTARDACSFTSATKPMSLCAFDAPCCRARRRDGDGCRYVQHTGLMWENAKQFGAMVVFAEHRYYGASQPLGNTSAQNLQYLTHEQALADYATLVGGARSCRSRVQPSDFAGAKAVARSMGHRETAHHRLWRVLRGHACCVGAREVPGHLRWRHRGVGSDSGIRRRHINGLKL